MQRCPLTSGEVSALHHELGNDAVEATPLVPKARLPSAELAEVLSSLGHIVAIQAKHNATDVLAANGNVKEHLGRHGVTGSSGNGADSGASADGGGMGGNAGHKGRGVAKEGRGYAASARSGLAGHQTARTHNSRGLRDLGT